MILDQAERILLAIAENHIKLNIMLWGPNGVGKTEIFREVARKLKWKFWLEHVPAAERTNIAGIPFTKPYKRKDGTEVLVQELAYPRFVVDAMDGGIVILFDEVNKTPKEVQASILEFINERSINGQPLDENILIGLTGNPPDERNSVKITDAAFNDRMVHIVIQNNPKATLEFFREEKKKKPDSKNLIDDDVLGFLTAHDKEIYEFDDRDKEFPIARRKTSRNWKERVNRIWKDLRPLQKEYGITDDSIYELIQGTIGEEATAKFMQFIKDNKKPITYEEIINLNEETIQRVRLYSGKNTEGKENLDNPIFMSLLSDACKNIISKRNDKSLLEHSENILRFFTELPESVVFSAINELLRSPHQTEWVEKLKEKVVVKGISEYKWKEIVEKQKRASEAEKARKTNAVNTVINNQNK